MKKFAFTVALAGLATLAGCIPCLRPIYTEKDLVFEPALVGVWSPPDSEATWRFSKAGQKSYRVVQTDEKGKTGAFAGHLVKLDGTLFLDLFPEDPKLPDSDFYKIHIHKVHTFMLVKQITPRLHMTFMDPKWVKEYLANNPDAIRHEKINDGILLTAPTQQLQAFLVKHSKTEEAFLESPDMERQNPPR